MKRHDLTARAERAARKGGAFVAGVTLRFAMLSNPGATIRSRSVSA